jgi:quinol monooxygenase YgiN
LRSIQATLERAAPIDLLHRPFRHAWHPSDEGVTAMTVLIRAELHGLAGRQSELRAVLQEHAAHLAGAADSLGAAAYEPLGAEPGEFVLDAWWRDEAALRAHYATAEYAGYAQRVGELLARPSDAMVHTIAHSYRPAGDLSADPARQG